MIALSTHPLRTDEPRKYVFIPMYFDPQPGAWMPLVNQDGFFLREIDAAHVCAADLEKRWAGIYQMVRTLRVFCDHPSFVEFTGDGIDADMIRSVVLPLSRVVDITDDHVRRLLSRATPEDEIRIGPRRYQMNADRLVLEPLTGAREGDPVADRPRIGHRPVRLVAVEDAMVALALLVDGDSAEELFARLMRRVSVRHAAGAGAARREDLERAAAVLADILGDGSANDNYPDDDIDDDDDDDIDCDSDD